MPAVAGEVAPGSPLTPIQKVENQLLDIDIDIVNCKMKFTLQDFTGRNGTYFSVDFTQWTASSNDTIVKASIKARRHSEARQRKA